MQSHEPIMQEYTQLRQEIRLYLSRRSRYELVLTAISAVAALSAKLNQPLPVLLMASLPIFLIEEQTRRLDAIYRIASYIRTHIEPNVEGLRWETYGTRLMSKRGHFSTSTHGLDVIIMTLLFMVQFIIAAFVWHSNAADKHIFNNANAWLLYPIGLLFLICLVLAILRFGSVKCRSTRYPEQWRSVASDEALDSRRNES